MGIPLLNHLLYHPPTYQLSKGMPVIYFHPFSMCPITLTGGACLPTHVVLVHIPATASLIRAGMICLILCQPQKS